MILDAATTDGSTILEPHLDNLLNVLFPQVRLEPSSGQTIMSFLCYVMKSG